MIENRCVVAPFRRDKKSDFAFASGEELLKSKIIQVLGTDGEMPWATSFGSKVNLLKHKKNDEVLASLARVYVREALKKWVPEVEVLDVQANRYGEKLFLEVGYRGSRRLESEDIVLVSI